MNGVASSYQEIAGLDANRHEDVSQHVGRLLLFLSDWIDQYRSSESTGESSIKPEEALILRKTSEVKRQSKSTIIALDFWAGQAYRERRLRDRVFGDPQLFGEPAWDLLLDVALAESKGVRLSVTSACIGACVPSTTALRWLVILEEKNLIRREDDGMDARRTFIRLTTEGLQKIVSYFEGITDLRQTSVRSPICGGLR